MHTSEVEGSRPGRGEGRQGPERLRSSVPQVETVKAWTSEDFSPDDVRSLVMLRKASMDPIFCRFHRPCAGHCHLERSVHLAFRRFLS